MDAALPVEEESASVSAPDHTSSSSLDVRQKVDGEKPGNGELKIEVDERDHRISHKEEPENEGMSPEERGIKEEDMASKHEDCAEERKESEDMAEENNNTSQEEEEKNISQVHSDLILQLDKDKTLDENILDNEGKEDMEEMEETSEEKNKSEEMEHEISEQYQEPRVMDVNVVGTVTPEGEGVKGEPEEKMQVAEPEAAEPFVNVGKCSDKHKNISDKYKELHVCVNGHFSQTHYQVNSVVIWLYNSMVWRINRLIRLPLYT